MKIKVISIDNKEIEEISLNKDIFGVEPRPDLVSKLINLQMSRRRSGNHKVKERGEIRGSTAKIYKQKGTGNARHGSKKVVQFKGGGVVHGPRVRTHDIKLPVKVRKHAMKSILSSKYKEGAIIVLDNFIVSKIKTSDLSKKLSKLGISSATMIDGKKLDNKFSLSIRNIKNINLLPSQGANAYDILRGNTLVFSKAGIQDLEKALS